MKKLLPLILLGAAFTAAEARDFSYTVRRGTLVEPPAPVIASSTTGSLQSAARVGNPVQVLNPLAPREYGSGAPYVKRDARVAYSNDRDAHGESRAVAVQLVAVEF